VGFSDDKNAQPLVEGIHFTLDAGETLGFVGESGSGKSLTSLSLLDLLPEALKRVGGKVFWEGKSLDDFSDSQKQNLRGQLAAMIFQNPLSALHPCYRIEEQIFECFHLAGNIPRKDFRPRALQLMKEVGILEPEQRLRAYPHELSGGMAQRMVIAMALARSPKVLIADEPTTALDVTIQAQVLRKIIELQRERSLALILVSHDLGVIAHMTKKILVFYAGQVVEMGETKTVLRNPRHPYTQALLKCRPKAKTSEFPFISGQVPGHSTWTQTCRTNPRPWPC
jgi:ABC-type dipeptide/oligopeptide/nickel transport system ATPase component